MSDIIEIEQGSTVEINQQANVVEIVSPNEIVITQSTNNVTIQETNNVVEFSANGPQGATGQGVPTGGSAGQVLSKIDATDYNTQWSTPSAGGGSGTVTSVSVTTVNGVSGSVANATTTPAISLTLGAITPTSIAASSTVTGSNLSGTNSGDQTVTLTGDVTGSGTGSFAATIASDAVTFAKMQNIATTSLLGRATASTGDIEVISLGTNLSYTGTTLSADGGIIPNGSSPTLNTAGQIALDTTDNQFLAYISSAVRVLAMPKKSLTFTLDAPTSSDVFPIIQLPYNVTLTNVIGTVYAATSATFQIQSRSSATLGSSGTNLLTSSLTATTSGANTTSFATATASTGYFLVLVASAVSGTPSKLTIEIDYTIDRT